jgi:2-(1,2-epoxy-1,2-dihydrophenyl)acetyl-CoA isomerase
MTAGGLRVEMVGEVCRIVLDRPSQRNALTRDDRLALVHALLDADADATVRVVVLTGAGDHFCSGGDIKEFGNILDIDEARDYATTFAQPVFRAMRTMTTPVVARVQGVAAGAGMFLALGCDIVVASENATFIASHLNLGVPPDWGAIWLLPRLVGTARAKAILLSRRPVRAATAATWGMIAECVPQAELDSVVEGYCRDLIAAPAHALGLARVAIDRSLDVSIEDFLLWENAVIAETLISDEHRQRVPAFMAPRQADLIKEHG